MKKQNILITTILICLILPQFLFSGIRIKELARLQGTAQQQLVGYGLVVGLNGSGDTKRSKFTPQSVVNMLQRFGITVPSAQMKIKNVAAVMVTSEAPGYLVSGDRLTVTVSSLGDAKSLENGILLMTPLVDGAGELYAMAQGPLTVGGFAVETSGGGGVRQNHTLVGMIPDGAIMQRSLGESYQVSDTLMLSLNNSDFTTAQRIVSAINTQFNDTLCYQKNPRILEVIVPPAYASTGQQHKFIAEMEQIEIDPDQDAKVVINERTGTVVVGGKVKLLPAAIAHGNLSVEIESDPIVSQPAPFSQGQTTALPNTQATVYTEPGKLTAVSETATVQDIAQALNSLGLSPRDIIAVLQALKEAGSLQAKLVIM